MIQLKIYNQGFLYIFVTTYNQSTEITANSPDLNLIEQVWDELGGHVRRNHAIHTVNDLAAALQAEWANLPAPFIQRYVNSMRRRITACIAQNGRHIRY